MYPSSPMHCPSNRRAGALRIAALAAATGLMFGCAQMPGERSVTHRGPPSGALNFSEPRTTIAELAADLVGVPCDYGGPGSGPGFDCSGLVYHAYATAGVGVPRSSQELFKAMRKIAPEAAVAGDLVFFQDQRRMSHVGIYLSDRLFVHAPSSGSAVRISSLDSAYYRRHLVAVGRLLPD